MNAERNFERAINRSINKETRKARIEDNPKRDVLNNIAYRIMQEALLNVKANILMPDINTYLIDIDMFLPNNIMENLEEFDKEKYTFSVYRNEKNCTTRIMIYDETKERIM